MNYDAWFEEESVPVTPCMKDLYRSASEANAFAVMRGVRMRAYYCSRCRAYHLTRKP